MDRGDDNGGRWDVVLSYASADRQYVARVASYLRERNLKVYYYEGDRPEVLGSNLESYLRQIYSAKARYYCIVFLSRAYAASEWTKLELRVAHRRATERREDYLIPARFDNTAFDLVDQYLAYADISKLEAEAFADLILQKVRARVRRRRLDLVLLVALFALATTATTGVLEARAIVAFRIPTWLTNEFIPAANDLALNADYVGQGGVDYLLTKPTTAAAFRAEVEGLATAIHQYNCAYNYFQSDKAFFAAQLAPLPSGALRDAADTVANDVKTRFSRSYRVPEVDGGGPFGGEHEVLLETWRANETRITTSLSQLRNDLAKLEVAGFDAAGLPPIECQHRARR